MKCKDSSIKIPNSKSLQFLLRESGVFRKALVEHHPHFLTGLFDTPLNSSKKMKLKENTPAFFSPTDRIFFFLPYEADRDFYGVYIFLSSPGIFRLIFFLINSL